MTENLSCWCGNTQFIPFSEDYLKCPDCLSLVWKGKCSVSTDTGSSLDFDYYGREYWFSHQTNDLGLQDIQDRSRLDLPERCLYWLRTIMKYRLPPAKVLELGSSHGALVALLKKSGYEAAGLEIDEWIVNYSCETFDINVYQGPIENQTI